MSQHRLLLFAFTCSLCLCQVVPGRYVVELRGEPAAAYAAKRGNTSTAAVERRAQISLEQQQTRAAVSQLGGQTLTSTDTVMNSLIVNHSDPEQLKSIPGVARVYPVYQVKASLSRVIHLHKVVDAWDRIGGVEKAGLGVRMGILDTGVDNTHPWLVDSELPPVEGFPKVSKEANLAYTSSKVIVARSYEQLSGESYSTDAADRDSHGTNAAAAAAAVPFAFRGLIVSGVAPRAYLGNYKVLGDNGGGSTDAIIKALDDGVKDGMDILNLSLGSDLAPSCWRLTGTP
ncbi:MAG: hypothetical protein FJW20_02235 [Acidimicrobiia bacterium]|nr:hypothetical protein [Acidimicrobiia bacterium]